MTDAMLREAAAKSCADFADFWEQDYDSENQHVFSDSFEKKMQKVQRRANHPTFYQARRLVASFLLVLLLGGGVWLTADAEARAAVWGWGRGIYETYFVFSYDEGPATEATAVYRPTWIPEGYTEFLVDDTGLYTYIEYSNSQGKILTLEYLSSPPDGTNWFFDISQAMITQTTVNGYPADLFISEDINVSSGIAWTYNNTAFYINGFVSESDLIAMAESIEK